jgi:uncharacterized protein (DUF697 family)
MADLKDLSSVWNNVKEMDLRPLRVEALRGVRIALVGRPGSGVHTLAEQIRRDPARPGAETQTPLVLANLDTADETVAADLIILMVPANAVEIMRERSLARGWADAGKKVLVFVNTSVEAVPEQAAKSVKSSTEGEQRVISNPWSDWGKRRMVFGPVDDSDFLIKEFVPEVTALLSDQLLALGRQFPLFRGPIARQLINDASFSNAAYALSTGIAEVVPIFDIPLNVADMVVLTKTQAFLVYKLGLTLGLSTRWQDYVTEFGGVLGGGFLWRQLARQLVGLIPAWGIVPKIAVSYAGTYVVGSVVLQWYLTGRQVTRQQMRQLYSQAFAKGKSLAGDLIQKMPRPRLVRRKHKALPAPEQVQICPVCGKVSAGDAQFCQYCGHALTLAEDKGEKGPPT